jgi:hypothetical protein
MKIALINGSPKYKNSASGILSSIFKRISYESCECVEVKMNQPTPSAESVAMLCECNTWIIFYPLYVDGVPSHLVSCMKFLEERKGSFNEKRIYAVSNCGFHDGRQCEWSLEVIAHWARHMGFEFCGGIGLGGGGAVPEVYGTPIGGAVTSNYTKALKRLLGEALEQKSFENFYASINLPRFVFKLAAERGWGRSLVKNGRKKKDIGNIPQ